MLSVCICQTIIWFCLPLSPLKSKDALSTRINPETWQNINDIHQICRIKSTHSKRSENRSSVIVCGMMELHTGEWLTSHQTGWCGSGCRASLLLATTTLLFHGVLLQMSPKQKMIDSHNVAQMQMSHKTNSCRSINCEHRQQRQRQREPQLRPALRLDHELTHSSDTKSRCCDVAAINTNTGS